MSLPLAATCGQLLVGGFSGRTPSVPFARALERGTLGGAILFKRNLGELREVLALTQELHARAVALGVATPLVAVDQEGGRVARLGAPVLKVPPMRTLGKRGDEALVEEVGRAQGRELFALGFTLNFAPVLDVDTNPANPIIGDRAFSADAREVARFGLAYARGLAASGVLACGKHFPGHGDTALDSHLALPSVDHERARLDAVELLPFRAAARAGLPSIMTAHVICRALDPSAPATLSRTVMTRLLREDLGFRGVLVSDDLEMKAVADLWPVEELATRAIDAGCDLLLVCSDEARQARAHEALVSRAQRDGAFRARCEEACARVLAMRRTVPAWTPPASAEDAIDVGARATLEATLEGLS